MVHAKCDVSKTLEKATDIYIQQACQQFPVAESMRVYISHWIGVLHFFSLGEMAIPPWGPVSFLFFFLSSFFFFFFIFASLFGEFFFFFDFWLVSPFASVRLFIQTPRMHPEVASEGSEILPYPRHFTTEALMNFLISVGMSSEWWPSFRPRYGKRLVDRGFQRDLSVQKQASCVVEMEKALRSSGLGR